MSTDNINPFKGASQGNLPSPILAVIAVVFICLIAATVIASLIVRSNIETVSQRNLEAAVEVAMEGINTDLTQGIDQIKAIQGLFNASDFVRRDEFEVFVRRFLEESKGIQALEWIPRVTAAQKEQFVDSIRKEGFEEFKIHPDTGSQDVFPVTYLAPFQGNAAALGFDLSSEEVRRAALMKAWETGEMAITEPITLVQETGSQSAFLAYAPIYSSNDIPPTLQERKDLLVGFSLGVIRFGDFINSALPDSFDPNIGVTVIDPDHPGTALILYTNQETDIQDTDAHGVEVIRSVSIADEEWLFHFGAPPGYGVGGFERAAWILVLVLGLSFSVVILSIVLLLYRSRQAALALYVERRETEQVQRALADDLTQLIETANNPIFGVDMDGLVNVWNQAMEVVTGISNTGASGHPAIQFIGLQSRDSAQERLQAVLAGESCENFELELPRSTGETATLLLNCTPRRDSQGTIVGAIAVGLDISERMRSEREIRELNNSLERRVSERTRELQEALEELESFSYSVSHDLRGPLRSINGFSLAVLEKHGDQLDEVGRSYLERVRASTQRMGKLIDDLLALSRVGRAELIREPLDIGKMAEEQAEELQAGDPERNVEFVIGEGATAFGDERLMGVVMDNLVGNAWKFSSKHATARIEVGKQEQNGETVYFVKDDGAGFDMEYSDKLFLPFQRLHPTGEFEGTGIGLATVKRIIQRHGGRIWAQGEVEKGATVYFTLGNHEDQTNE